MKNACNNRRNAFRQGKEPALSLLLLVLFAVLFACGCNGVRRRLVIQTEPEGATVWINDQEIGQTPIAQNITYSGTYKVRLAMEGKKTKTVMYRVRTPWYLWPGVDFISENLVPGEIRDIQTCNETLEPELIPVPEELFENAEKMRTEAHSQADLLHYQGAVSDHSDSSTSATEENSETSQISEAGWVHQP